MSQQSIFVAVPLDAVVTRMPATVRADGVVVCLAPAGATADRLRYDGDWSAAGAGGSASVDLVKVSPTASQVEVTLGGPGAKRAWGACARSDGWAAAIATALAAQLEQRPWPTSQPAPPRRRPLRAAIPVAAAMVMLAVVAGSAVLAPSPVTVDAATARYRAAVAASASRTAAAPETADTPQPGDTRQARAGRHTGGGAPPVDPPGQSRRAGDPAAPAQTATRRTRATAQAPPQPSATNGQRNGDSNDTAQHAQVVPDPGVYRYATDGWEEVDAPGGHRRFPSETTQTVVHSDCGYRMRWDPLEERWDDNALCVGNGTPQPVEHRTYRSFFGRAVEQHFVCRPAKVPRGAVWAVRCASDDTTMTTVARALGRRTMGVDGDKLDVRGLQVDSVLDGANTGRRTAEMWHARASGILVRTEVAAQLEVEGPFGRIDYREQYTLHLASQTPHR